MITNIKYSMNSNLLPVLGDSFRGNLTLKGAYPALLQAVIFCNSWNDFQCDGSLWLGLVWTSKHNNHSLQWSREIMTQYMNKFDALCYQNLTNFFRSLVCYQVPIDFSKLVPHMHQTWPNKPKSQQPKISSWKKELWKKGINHWKIQTCRTTGSILRFWGSDMT